MFIVQWIIIIFSSYFVVMGGWTPYRMENPLIVGILQSPKFWGILANSGKFWFKRQFCFLSNQNQIWQFWFLPDTKTEQKMKFWYWYREKKKLFGPHSNYALVSKLCHICWSQGKYNRESFVHIRQNMICHMLTT